MTAHPEVAAYALGLMEPEEARRFEEHLAGCEACADELQDLLPVAGLLADVDPEDVFDEPPGPRSAGRRPGRRPSGAAAAARAQRRRVPLAVAAGFAGLALGAGAVAASGWLPDRQPSTAAGTPTPGPTATPAAEVLSGTGSSGVHADVSLTSKAWGTLVAFRISDITGPRECRLVAERKDGSTEVLSSWLIPEQGYDGDTRPEALSLTAATALRRDDIRALSVQQVGGTTLVSVEA